MVIGHLARLWRNEQGATAIEYGLIAALIVIAMMAGLTNFANQTTEMYNNISTTMTNAAS